MQRQLNNNPDIVFIETVLDKVMFASLRDMKSEVANDDAKSVCQSRIAF